MTNHKLAINLLIIFVYFALTMMYAMFVPSPHNLIEIGAIVLNLSILIRLFNYKQLEISTWFAIAWGVALMLSEVNFATLYNTLPPSIGLLIHILNFVIAAWLIRDFVRWSLKP